MANNLRTAPVAASDAAPGSKAIPAGLPQRSINPLDASALARSHAQRQSLLNLLRMGHCAPTVMQTLLDLQHQDKEWLVKLTAGMPGGVANTGFECGGLTSPLLYLGLDHGFGPMQKGLPQIVYEGHGLCQRFTECQSTLLCKQIRGNWRVPIPCIGVIRRAPKLYAESLSSDNAGSIPDETREAYSRLDAHLNEQCFHCAHAVFENLHDTIPFSQELLDATAGFMGGTVFKGMTCSAFAAGVMAVGLRLGEIETSRRKVLRMIALMAIGGNAFDDHLNKFNRLMNMGYRMSRWFKREFGSTQCRAITRCDFSSAEGVSQYIDSDEVTRCRSIAEKVAEKVRSTIEEAERKPAASPSHALAPA